ncbi:MAG TPA: PD-(D/E)XK motif protein [Allosphingosinicella sp.]|jgi:hypothetical protein
MTAVAAAWQALRAERRSEAGWHLRQLHPGAPCQIFAAIHQPDDRPGLIVEADATALGAAAQVPKSAGFRVEAGLLGHSHHGRVRIILSLAHAAYAQVFAILCADAVDMVTAQKDDRSAIGALISRLHVWQAFMARHGPDGLSEAAMIGLMGELLVLRDHLEPLIGIARALETWAGPRGEPNDFSLAGGFLEIKATTRQAPDRLSISNADQLDIGRGPILLGHVRFRETPDGETLPDMVDAIKTILAADAPSALPMYAAALLAAGYVDAHRQLYDMALLSAAFDLFEITPDFPHLARAELRRGIIDCSYMIDLAACRPWTVPANALASFAGSFDG